MFTIPLSPLVRFPGAIINQLSKLNISGHAKLEVLEVCNNSLMTSLDAIKCKNLLKLDCHNDNQFDRGNINHLDVSECSSLQILDCSNNKLTNIGINGCTALEELYCQHNWISQNIGDLFFQLKAFKFSANDDIYVSFGEYEQNNDFKDKEPIIWRAIDGRKNAIDPITLISVYCLDAKQYNTVERSVTWSNCTLRTWLNNVFLNTAFTSSERSRLLTSTVNTDGSITKDKVYILDIDNADDFAHVVYPTIYADDALCDAMDLDHDNKGWYGRWTRTPCGSSHGAYVYIEMYGPGVYYVDSYGWVQPVVQIQLMQ